MLTADDSASRAEYLESCTWPGRLGWRLVDGRYVKRVWALDWGRETSDLEGEINIIGNMIYHSDRDTDMTRAFRIGSLKSAPTGWI